MLLYNYIKLRFFIFTYYSFITVF